MHTRRSATIPSLSLVLPHPPLPRCRASSIRSSNDGYTTPRTPRSSCGLSSPSLLKLDMPAPRTSTDSWNSSIADGGEDDMEWEWTAEQEAMLVKVSSCCIFVCSLVLHGPLSTRRQVPAKLSSMTARALLARPTRYA
jgi:hypothetical protein